MKVSDLIVELSALMAVHGDVDVYCDDEAVRIPRPIITTLAVRKGFNRLHVVTNYGNPEIDPEKVVSI